MSVILVDYELELHDERLSTWTKVHRPPGQFPGQGGWIHEHCTGQVILSQNYLHFEIEAEAIYFKLMK